MRTACCERDGDEGMQVSGFRHGRLLPRLWSWGDAVGSSRACASQQNVRHSVAARWVGVEAVVRTATESAEGCQHALDGR